MADETPWDSARYAEELRRVTLERNQLRQQLAAVEVVDLARVELKRGDTLLVRPRECAGIVNADQAREWADWLREYFAPRHPGVEVLVLPLASEVAVIGGGTDG